MKFKNLFTAKKTMNNIEDKPQYGRKYLLTKKLTRG